MAKTKPGTVKETGAKAGDILVGVGQVNKNLRIRLHKDQPMGDGGRIVGSFDLVQAGTGTYSSFLEGIVEESFISANELITRVASKSGAQKCTHIVNRNTLKVDDQL